MVVSYNGQFDRNDPKYRFCGCIHSETAVLILTWLQLIGALFGSVVTVGTTLLYAIILIFVLVGVHNGDHHYLIPYLVLQFIVLFVLYCAALGGGIILLLGTFQIHIPEAKHFFVTFGGVLYLYCLIGLLVYTYFTWTPYNRAYQCLRAQKRSLCALHVYLNSAPSLGYQITQNNYQNVASPPPPPSVGYQQQASYNEDYMQAPPSYDSAPSAPPADFNIKYPLLNHENDGYHV